MKTLAFKDKKLQAAMLGLDGSGKTSILHMFRSMDLVRTVPTFGKYLFSSHQHSASSSFFVPILIFIWSGFNVDEIFVQSKPGVSISIWDVGGLEKLR